MGVKEWGRGCERVGVGVGMGVKEWGSVKEIYREGEVKGVCGGKRN